MITIRRIYVYLLAFAGLLMLAGGAANLGRVLLEVLFAAPASTSASYLREEVSRWGAAAVVGLPVWLLHWWWAHRAAQASPDEAVSALRRLFLYLVLGMAVLAGASALHEALRNALEARPPSSSLPPLAIVAVALVVWVYHWPFARQVGAHGGTLSRWYIYGAAFVGYLLLLNGARLTLERAWELAVSPPFAATPPTVSLAGGISDALIGLGVWLLHGLVLRPAHDERATLRSVYLFLTLAIAVAGSVAGLSQVLYYALGRGLGVDRPGGVGGTLLEAAAGPVSILVVYGCGWLYTRAALREQAAALETRRQAGVRRLYTYLVALIGLAALTVGTAGLLWVVGDALTSAPSTAGGDWWRDRVSGLVTLTVVGLLVWLLHWRPEATPAPEELSALSRRLYVYLALIAGSLTLLGSAALAAYRLLTVVLGAPAGASLASDLAHDLANVAVAGVVIAYHWAAVRGPSPAMPTKEYEAVLRVRAPDAAALEHAIQQLRASGLQVEAVR